MRIKTVESCNVLTTQVAQPASLVESGELRFHMHSQGLDFATLHSGTIELSTNNEFHVN